VFVPLNLGIKKDHHRAYISTSHPADQHNGFAAFPFLLHMFREIPNYVGNSHRRSSIFCNPEVFVG